MPKEQRASPGAQIHDSLSPHNPPVTPATARRCVCSAQPPLPPNTAGAGASAPPGGSEGYRCHSITSP